MRNGLGWNGEFVKSLADDRLISGIMYRILDLLLIFEIRITLDDLVSYCHIRADSDDDAFEFPLNVKANAALSATTPVIPLPQLEPTLSAWPPMPDIDVAPILDLVHNAGPDGLTRAELHIQSGYSTPDLLAAYASLAMDSTPEVFWAGYDTARLVSAKHWDAWTHPIDGARIRPRRWTDIFGNMTEDWKRCLRCVATNITTRPGILIVSDSFVPKLMNSPISEAEWV